jgi:zinc protease
MAHIQRIKVPRLALLGLLVLSLLPGCKKTVAPDTSGSTAVAPEPFADGWPGMPVPSAAPDFEVPAAEEFTLSNGIPVTAIQRGSIPLVYLKLNIYSGSEADPAGKEGLAAFTADLMNEGTATRDALQISDALQRMASSLGLGASLSSSFLSMNCLEDNLGDTLALARDILENPSFNEADIDRVRGDRQNRLLTARDNPGSVNYKVFAKLLYGDYYAGRPSTGSAESLDAIGRDDMLDWYKSAWIPSNAGLVVVSRLDTEDIKSALEQGLGSWTVDGGTPPVSALVTPEPTEGMQLYWIDRPGASQSYIQMGRVSPAFNPEKHQARSLGNMVLGGQFSSRLNLNLREDKGYTYGARSGVWSGQHGGMFRARSSVRTLTTGPALHEFFKELEDITGSRPITQSEFDAVVSRSEQGYPGRFENMSTVLGIFAGADADHRPEGWLAGHDARVRAVSLEDAQAAIAGIVDLTGAVVVVVGDWNAVVESPQTADGRERPITVTVGDHVRGLNRGDVIFLDEDGYVVEEPSP